MNIYINTGLWYVSCSSAGAKYISCYDPYSECAGLKTKSFVNILSLSYPFRGHGVATACPSYLWAKAEYTLQVTSLSGQKYIIERQILIQNIEIT